MKRHRHKWIMIATKNETSCFILSNHWCKCGMVRITCFGKVYKNQKVRYLKPEKRK